MEEGKPKRSRGKKRKHLGLGIAMQKKQNASKNRPSPRKAKYFSSKRSKVAPFKSGINRKGVMDCKSGAFPSTEAADLLQKQDRPQKRSVLFRKPSPCQSVAQAEKKRRSPTQNIKNSPRPKRRHPTQSKARSRAVSFILRI